MNKILGFIFGLVFAGVGVFFLLQTSIPTFADWYAMQGWESISGQLISINGSDKSKASYLYTVNGVSYEGERVYVASFNENNKMGNYQKKQQDIFISHLLNKKPIDVWVNLDMPEQAVIDRDMRWSVFLLMSAFFSVFIIIGVAFSMAMFSSGSSKRKFVKPSTSELRREWNAKLDDSDFQESFIEYQRFRLHDLKQQWQREHGEPVSTDKEDKKWQERKGWETNRIRSDAISGIKLMWFLALVFSAVSIPIFSKFEEELAKGDEGIYVALIFPLVGLFLIFQSIKKTREYLRFSVVEFEMDPYPGSIGGNVGGAILIRKDIPQLDSQQEYSPFKVVLDCVYSYMSGSGDDRSRSESIKWAEEGFAKVERSTEGVRLLFRFDVPDNLHESDVEQSADSYYFWRLKIEGDIPGVDLKRSYNIPVFKTGEQSRRVRHDLSEQSQQIKAQESREDAQAIAAGNYHLTDISKAATIEQAGYELNMAFPMFRNKYLTVFSWIFALGFGFASYSIIQSLGHGFFSIIPLLMLLPFGSVALFSGIAAIYLPFNNLRIRVTDSELTILRRLLFIPILSKQIQNSEIRHLSIDRSGSTGQGTEKIEHYKIYVHCSGHNKYIIAEGINGEDLATSLKDDLERRMNLDL